MIYIPDQHTAGCIQLYNIQKQAQLFLGVQLKSGVANVLLDNIPNSSTLRGKQFY